MSEDSTWYLVFVVKFVDLADITINNKQLSSTSPTFILHSWKASPGTAQADTDWSSSSYNFHSHCYRVSLEVCKKVSFVSKYQDNDIIRLFNFFYLLFRFFFSICNTYEESTRGAASGLRSCHFFPIFWWLQTSLLSLFLVQMGTAINMLVSEHGAVNWLWSLMVLGQIYGYSNFGHNFCQLALLAIFMAKIWLAINLAQDHKWSIPLASLLPQALTPTSILKFQPNCTW